MGERGAVWQGVWAIAFAFLCVYIAFEVLDLDGSQLRLRSGAAITAETSSAEADRVLRASPPPLTVRLHPHPLVTPHALRLQPVTSRPRPVRADRALPRRDLGRLGSSSPAESADPV